MTREFDSPWKETLDLFLEAVIKLFFPDLYEAIDWSRGYKILDTEMHEIVREAELGVTQADKLFLVHLRDGREALLLIHCEVQAQRDSAFPQRMFMYYYRIFDRYRHPIVSLAILGDDHPEWRPNRFLAEQFGTRISLDFRTVKLLDWVARAEELENSPNPISLIVRAHLHSLQTKDEPAERYRSKWQLIRGLYDRGLDPEQVRQLFRLIDWLLELPRELQQELRRDIETLEKERSMPYVTSVERLAREEGEAKGRSEGEAKGRIEGRIEGEAKGRIEGEAKGRIEVLSLALELKFSDAGRVLAEELQTISDLTLLKAIQDAIRSNATLEEIRTILSHAVHQN
jgi:hypothetical protein